MKILFVCSAREWGGNEKWSSMAMEELRKQGHSVFMMVRNPFLMGRFGKTLPWAFAPFITPFDPFTYLIAFFVLLIKRPDAVVSTKRTEYFILGVLTRLFKIRHILRLGIVRDLDTSWKKFVYTRLNEGIIVNARKTKENFEKYDFVDQSRIRLIYNGIPPIPAEARPAREDSRFRIVSVGTLTPRKGFHILMDAMAGLPPELLSRIHLTIVGGGIMKNELMKQIKDQNLEDHVTMAGYQSSPVPFLLQADLFALTTENEGISNALLEAMILGVPSMTTPSGGTEEFMEDGVNGFLVERDSSVIRERLKDLLARRETLSAVGEAGKARVEEFFSLTRMGREVADFLAGPAES